jgi:hypothetical protein
MNDLFTGVACALIGASLVLVVACGIEKSTPRTDMQVACYPETTERRASFVIDCAKAANPLSDEEGEDLVKQCQKTAEELFCSKEKHVEVSDYRWIPCNVVTDPRSKEACK